MFKEEQETFVSELAEQLTGSWSKLGAAIGWSEPSGVIKGIDGENPEEIREAAARSMSDGVVGYFDCASGKKGLVAPVFNHGRCAGCIVCILPAALSDQSEGLFEILTRQVRQVQRNYEFEDELTAISEQLAGSYEELSLIYKLGQQLHITDDPAAFMSRFEEDLLDLIGAQALILMINHPLNGGESCFVRGKMSISDDSARALCRYLMGLIGSASEPIILPDLSTQPALVRIFKSSDLGILGWPIYSNGSTLGILTAVSTNSDDSFDSSDAKLLGSVAEHTASFLQNRFLLADIQDLLTGLTSSLVGAIDAKDPYTRGHSQRVALIGRRIAEAMGLTKKECAQIYMAGLLHDIGKIGVNDHVLAKPGKLTREEFANVQEHPVIGSRIISSVRQLRNILPGVLDHHERYDGGGYPEGLTGEQIPLMGMIVGLADSFDAITSERTYHEAKTFQEAIEEVRRCEGTQFSPAVVRGLLECDLEQLEKDLQNCTDNGYDVLLQPALNWLEQCR